MKFRTIILLGVVMVLIGITTDRYMVPRMVQSRIYPQHVFELSESPSFLATELALTMARETLVRDGIDLTIWRNQHAAHNLMTSNRVVLAFTNGSGLMRLVSVELTGNRVICQGSIGK